MTAYLLALAMLQAATPSWESEPEVPVERLVETGTPLSGAGWHVESPVPVRGFLGQFVLQTRWGPVEAQGREMLALRIGELPALEALDAISHTDVFAGALAESARSTGEVLGRVVTRPVETAKGIPAGIGRLVRRTAGQARRLAVDLGDAARRAREEPAGEGEGEGEEKNAFDMRDFANELAGVNKARRSLASQLGIDPYTGNPLVQERLEELAWAAVAGGLSMDLMLGEVGDGVADVISTSRELHGLVWDLPPADVRRQLEARLVERGTEPLAAREFLRNRAFTPTLQVEFVEALESLGRPIGEADTVRLAESLGSEVHARFLVQQLEMLEQQVGREEGIAELVVFEASVGGLSRGGTLWITLPVDYLYWNESADLVAAKDDDPPSRLAVAGHVSDQARNELERAGWTVFSDVGLRQ